MSYLKILIILLIYSIKPILLNKNTKNITLKQGTIRGVVKNLKMARNSNLRVAIFKGIPYAAPPIGELRFMPTVGAPSWFGVKIADHFAPVCPQIFPDVDKMADYRKRQFENLKIFLENQSEDCLYLNIYAPVQDNELNNRKYPVMLFIHGESFEWNSGNPYDGSILSAYGNVVVVTINFRLGIFGFLKAGTEELARSNFGLVDQIASLIWIRDNIAAFGGDSNSVTIFGHGTGAVCAGLLMISPMVLLGNDRLFHRAILMGGSALSDWALAGNPGEVTYQMSKLLNCQLHDDFAECLRRKRVDEIMRAAENVVTPDYKTRFGPIVDSLLVPNQPRKSMTQYNDIFKRFELMYGVAEMESINILDSSHLIHGFLQTKRDQELRNYFRFRCEIKPEFCLQRTLDEYSQNNEFLSKFNVRRHILYNIPKNVSKNENNALKNEYYQSKNANNVQNMNNVPKNGNNASKNENYGPKNENNAQNTFNVQKSIKNVQNIINLQKNGNNVQKSVKNVQDMINVPKNGNNKQNKFNVQKSLKNVQKSVKNVQNSVKNVRFKRNGEPDPATVARDVFLDILSDARSVAPILEMGRFHSAVNMQSYFYVFKHKTQSRDYIREKTYSGDELDYIFGIPFVSDSLYTEQEKLFSEILMMYFSNFAETGNPNVPRKEGFSSMSPAFWAQFDVEWPEFDNKQEQYLELEIPPQPSDHYRSTKMKYWNSIFPNLISSNFTYLPSKSSPPPLPPKFFPPPPKNIYENFEKPLKSKEGDVFGKVVEKGRGRPENVVEGGVFGKIVEAPSKEKEENSMMNIVAVAGGLFLLANFVLLVILYVKCRNRKKITTTSNEEKLHPDIDDISPLTGCNITRIFSTSSSSTPNPSNRSPTTTSNYPLHRQISSSTIDAHTKVRDWITNEIIHKYSPKIFRKNPPKTTQQPQSPPKTSTITPRPKLPKISVAVDATPASRNHATKLVLRRSFTPPPKLRTFSPDTNLTKSFDNNAICDVTFTSDYDVNVTSRDDSILPPLPLTPQQSLMIIKRRNCPKVLPEFPEKRRSCMEFTSPKIAPIKFFHTVEDEPEIVCNNLYFGPLLPKHDKNRLNEAKIGVNGPKKGANGAKIDVNEVKLDINEAKSGVNKTKIDANEGKYGVNEYKREVNEAKCGINEATYSVNDAKGVVNEAKHGINEAKHGANETKCDVIKAKSGVNETKYGINEPKVGVKGVVRRLDPKVVIRPGMKISEKTTPVHRVIAPDNQPCPGVKLEEIYAKIDIKPTEMLNKNSSSSESSPSDLSDTGTVVKKA